MSWRVRFEIEDGAVNIQDAGEFDEVVVDNWFHLERMSRRTWSFNFGNALFAIHIGKRGKVTITLIENCNAPDGGQVRCRVCKQWFFGVDVKVPLWHARICEGLV